MPVRSCVLSTLHRRFDEAGGPSGPELPLIETLLLDALPWAVADGELGQQLMTRLEQTAKAHANLSRKAQGTGVLYIGWSPC
jgi:hypothetical protein